MIVNFLYVIEKYVFFSFVSIVYLFYNIFLTYILFITWFISTMCCSLCPKLTKGDFYKHEIILQKRQIYIYIHTYNNINVI